MFVEFTSKQPQCHRVVRLTRSNHKSASGEERIEGSIDDAPISNLMIAAVGRDAPLGIPLINIEVLYVSAACGGGKDVCTSEDDAVGLQRGLGEADLQAGEQVVDEDLAGGVIDGDDADAVGGEDAAGPGEGEAGAEAEEAALGKVEEGQGEGRAVGLEKLEEGERVVGGGVGHEEVRRLEGEEAPARRQGGAVGAAAGAEGEEVVQARQVLGDVGDQLRRDVGPVGFGGGGGGGRRIRAAVVVRSHLLTSPRRESSQ